MIDRHRQTGREWLWYLPEDLQKQKEPLYGKRKLKKNAGEEMADVCRTGQAGLCHSDTKY